MEMKVVEFLENSRKIFTVIIENELGWFLIAFVGVILLMAVDMLTGFSQAKINNKLASHKMSDGLLKKFNILIVIIVLMFVAMLLPKSIGNTTLIFVYVYEYVNELISIGENLLKMNIQNNFMQPILKTLNKYLNNYEKGDKK